MAYREDVTVPATELVACIIGATEDIRSRPSARIRAQHAPGTQACHKVGLNLIKRVVNAHAGVWKVRKVTCDAFVYAIKDVANDDTNFDVCSVYTNSTLDKQHEKEVLDVLFKQSTQTYRRDSEPSRMFFGLITFLRVVQDHIDTDGESVFVNRIITWLEQYRDQFSATL